MTKGISPTSGMKPKERALRIINHQEADRVTVDFDIEPSDELLQRLKKEFSVSSKEEVLRILGVDFRNTVIYTSAGIPSSVIDDQHQLNAWGVTHHRHLGSAVGHPFKDVVSIKEVEQHGMLNPDDVDYDSLEKAALEYEGFCVYGGYWAPLTYIAQSLFGMERYMMLFYDDPELLEYVLDRITDIAIEINKRIFHRLGKSMDIYFMGDDYGTQVGLLTSKGFWLDFIKPRLKRIIDEAKNAGYLVQFHSCGSVSELIPEFIEMGVDVLNPIQVAASGMAVGGLKKQFGSRISFNGGIDTQELLPFGSKTDVRNAVHETLLAAAVNGGYIFAPSQSFLPEVPTENIVAMYNAAMEYGVYPLK